MKSRIFIGSSSESIEIAKIVKKNFEPEFECEIWTDNFFKLNLDTYHNLIREAVSFDYAVFIGGMDDQVKRIFKGAKKIAPRDNVYLEFGLYAGILTSDRSYFLVHKSCTIASDLMGITIAKYQDTKDVLEGCKQIKIKIQEEEKINRIGLLPSTSLAIAYFENFLKPMCISLCDLKELEIEGKKYAIDNCRKGVDILVQQAVTIDWKSASELRFKEMGAKNISIHASNRMYSVWVDFTELCSHNGMRIMDVPITLSSAFKAVELAMGKDYVGNVKQLISGKEKERRNFIKTLDNLVKEDAYTKRLVNII